MKKCNEEGVTFEVSCAAIENMDADRENTRKIAQLVKNYHLSCTHSINSRGDKVFYISGIIFPKPTLNPLKMREYAAQRKAQTELIKEIRCAIMQIRNEQILKGIQNEVTSIIYNFIDENISSKKERSLEEQQCEMEEIAKGIVKERVKEIGEKIV